MDETKSTLKVTATWDSGGYVKVYECKDVQITTWPGRGFNLKFDDGYTCACQSVKVETL